MPPRELTPIFGAQRNTHPFFLEGDATKKVFILFVPLLLCEKLGGFGMNSGNFVLFAIFCLFLLLSGVAAGGTGENAQSEEPALYFTSSDLNYEDLSASATITHRKIIRAKGTISKLTEEGLATTRVRDTVQLAENIFEATALKEQSGQIVDYSVANEKADEAIALSQKAFQAKDELAVLKESIDAIGEGIDVSPVIEIYELGIQELKDQRYELAIVKVEEAYEKLVEIQSVEARTSAMYSAASKNITTFLIENRLLLAALIGGPLALYLMFKDKIKTYTLERKIDGMNVEISVLQSQIKKSQKEYFVDGTMPESTYGVREKVYGEMIRNLNRDIALIKEEIEKSKVRNRRKVQLRNLIPGEFEGKRKKEAF